MSSNKHHSKLIWLLLLLGLMASCSNPYVLSDTACLIRSEYNKGEFPYTLTINTHQNMRFNPHTLAVMNTKVEGMVRVFLKRKSGTLTTGEFDVSVYGPTPSRGTVTIRDGRVVIDIETGRLDSDGHAIATAWQKSLANGEYKLLDQS